MKKTVTQWTTTTRRETQGRPQLLTMVDLDEALAGTDWDKVVSRVEHMPLGKAMELRRKLNNLFGVAA